jgi:ABC-type lipoprotein export system ATPase subunit
MVTHSSEHAAFANRVLHLFDGKIVSENIQRITYV